MAPEVIRGDEYDSSADIWSLGCTVFEMLVGRPPDYGMPGNPMAMMYKLSSSDAVPELPDDVDVSAEGQAFLRQCFQRNPWRRASAGQLAQHAWIAKHTAGRDPDQQRGEETRIEAAATVGRSPTPRENQTASPHAADAEGFANQGDADRSLDAPRCQRCIDGIALYSCDQCRRLACAHRRCPACWGEAHATMRAAGHRKGPLLLRDAESPSRNAPGATVSADGVLLPGGRFVDLVLPDEVEWDCGRCGTANLRGASACNMCDHMR
jgi:hypothetical protein